MRYKTRTISNAVWRAEEQLSHAQNRKEIDALEKKWLRGCNNEFNRLFERPAPNLDRRRWRVAFLRILVRHVQAEAIKARNLDEIWGSV